MKIDEFISKWKKAEPDSIFVKYNPQILLQRGVSEELKNQLSEYGLPESAAPYLVYRSFVEETLSDHVKNDCKEYGKLMLQLKKTLTQIDEKAMEDDGFWAMEISSLCEDI